MEVVRVPDELLARAAKERGPRSTEARLLEDIRSQRALDRQIFAFRCGTLWHLGSTPDAAIERAMIEMAQDLE
jgi:hypothetical protein